LNFETLKSYRRRKRARGRKGEFGVERRLAGKFKKKKKRKEKKRGSVSDEGKNLKGLDLSIFERGTSKIFFSLIFFMKWWTG
jgi:hypothetical protein